MDTAEAAEEEAKPVLELPAEAFRDPCEVTRSASQASSTGSGNGNPASLTTNVTLVRYPLNRGSCMWETNVLNTPQTSNKVEDSVEPLLKLLFVKDMAPVHRAVHVTVLVPRQVVVCEGFVCFVHILYTSFCMGCYFAVLDTIGRE